MTLPLKEIVSQATHAPTVHNVQPARWISEDDTLTLLRHRDITLPHADPKQHDIQISIGAALEGVAIAASSYGYSAKFEMTGDARPQGNYETIARISFEPGADRDPLEAFVETRASWRGSFSKPALHDRETAQKLQTTGCSVVSSQLQLDELGKLADRASMHFMADAGFRKELVSWMRFSKSHPRWQIDGLNANAMNMGAIEAFGASIILGKIFHALNKLGLAGAIVSEAKRYRNAAGLMVIHRPKDETPVEMGRHFYRHWLQLEQAGFGANVVAALADDDHARNEIHTSLNLPEDCKIITAFLFGKMPEGKTCSPRARLPLSELLVEKQD